MGSPITDLLPDFPNGPLKAFRRKASFDWRKLKLEMETEDYIRYKNTIWQTIRQYDIQKDYGETPSLDEQRRKTQERIRVLFTKIPNTIEQTRDNIRNHLAWVEAIFMFDLAAGMSYSIAHKMFASVIWNFGTERHDKFIKAVDEGELVGCFALTEIAHGSNVKGMKTTATYDPATKEFIIHSASFEAAKCWAGLLGKRATHAAVFAKLITPDGNDNGLHIFIVPIRCPYSLKPFAGIIIGDMGEKIGLNGVDNGFITFNSYRIPAENFLNRMGDVDEVGNYTSPIKSENQRLAMIFGILSIGRSQIAGISCSYIVKAITIAVRYSSVRKQFGPENSNEEFPIITYQQQQCRLMPYVAAAFCTRIFTNWLIEVYCINEIVHKDPLRYMEGHGISSATKPIITWMARDCIQICREACGGHGYLKAAGFVDIRSENDASCTYEGENNLLLKQTSNWIMSLLRKLECGEKIAMPYGTVDFLNDYKEILQTRKDFKSIDDFLNVQNVLFCYEWLICFTMKQTGDKMKEFIKKGSDETTANNNSQTFYANILSTAFAEYCILKNAFEFVNKMKDKPSKDTVTNLCSLFGAWCLDKHLGVLYSGGLFKGNETFLLREAIIKLCAIVTPDSVSLVDTLAPPDFILNSILGKSDGRVYENLQAHFYSSQNAFSRPHWWKEIMNYDKSKL